MSRRIFFIASISLFLSCSGLKDLTFTSYSSPVDSTQSNDVSNIYDEISGFYSCNEINMLIWLYEDGSFVERNVWGWFAGYYEPDFFYNDNYPGKCAIRVMEKYPPIRDLETKAVRYVYQKNKWAGWKNDRFFVYDRDFAPEYIRHVYYDGANSTRMKIDSLYKDTIPFDATEICVSNAGEITSPNAPYKKGYNIVFFVRPNFNRTNLIWDKKDGLKYESNNGKIYYFKRRPVKGSMLRVSPTIKENESFQNGELYRGELPDASFPNE